MTATEDLKSQISNLRKFGVSESPRPFVHKASPLYVGDVCFAEGTDAARFLAELTPRQIAIAAAYLDGFTQSEIAEQNEIDQTSVSRDLAIVRGVCKRFGRELPKPLKAKGEKQLSAGLYKAL